MMTGKSLWATSAINQLSNSADEPLHRHIAAGFQFDIKVLGDSLWVIGSFNSGNHIALRAAYSPDGFAKVEINEKSSNSISIVLGSSIGNYQVSITWPEDSQAILHYTASITLTCNALIPFWPRDIIAYGAGEPAGDIHIAQTGTRSGLLYGSFKKPVDGCFLYLQNLTALSAYNIDTETSAGGIVGGQWPEMGLSLPPTIYKPLQKGKTYIISDAFISFSKVSPADQFETAKGFLQALGELYLLLPRPQTAYQDYLKALPKTLQDLQTNKGCWSHRSGHPYLNAYLCDYQTPPEIMVQLAVLLPLQDYMRWSGETCTVAQDISDGLSAFYDEQLGTVMRWLPAEEHRLDKSEEQKTPKVMDAWYLHHPLLNLARMAKSGDDLAKELLLKSVGYAIKVAQHFNYCWPVFYKMDTLEVLKSETKPGEGGEKDVAGLYAHVMLQVWEITKEQKYFSEAEKAAQSLLQHGFNVFYQANNTMFSAKAMIYLYTQTKKELYRDLSYLFLANIFKNVALWECTYGFGKNFPTFFELFPLNDAPYTAVYEEQESYAGVHEFINYAQGLELLPAVNLLIAEFARYAVHRMIYYYPPMLPPEMLAKKAKTGELDPKLWIALEDVHDGWEQSGNVGQEVYGAGLAFGIVPRQYIRIPGKEVTIFIDYPVLNKVLEDNSLRFDIMGDGRLTCGLRIIKQGDKELPAIKIKASNADDQKQFNNVKQLKDGVEYRLHGNQQLTISWD